MHGRRGDVGVGIFVPVSNASLTPPLCCDHYKDHSSRCWIIKLSAMYVVSHAGQRHALDEMQPWTGRMCISLVAAT